MLIFQNSLNTLILLSGLALVSGAAFFLWRGRNSKSSSRYKAKTFLSAAEKEFFAVLCAAVPELHVFPQVSMGAIMESTSNMKARDPNVRKKALGEWSAVRANRIDYCIVNGDLELMCLVELDDRSHASNEAKKKDRDRDARVAEAGYRTVRFGWTNGRLPNAAEVRAQLLA